MTGVKKRRLFYGVELIDAEIAYCLDAIRFLAEPGYYRRTHITVRGPYERELNSRVLSSINETFSEQSRGVVIEQVGSFFFQSQNTVVLFCEMPGIRDVWNKPDFADGRPHITLYDGKSRADAMALLHVLKRHRWNIFSKCSEIKLLEAKSHPTEDFSYLLNQPEVFRTDVFGDHGILDVSRMPILDRLIFVERLCRFLDKHRGRGRFF